MNLTRESSFTQVLAMCQFLVHRVERKLTCPSIAAVRLPGLPRRLLLVFALPRRHLEYIRPRPLYR